ncbi:MAG: hypothetical protein U0930_03690 [Pirellulales bacterium]
MNQVVMAKRWFVAMILFVTLIVSGCDEAPIRVQPLPVPPAEVPPVNLPVAMRQHNWTRTNARGEEEGSCVFASLISHVRWQNRPKLSEYIRANFGGGEYDSRLRQKLDNIGVYYDYTVRADPRFLDWASETRRGAILWWKPYHCCTFFGWARGADGRQYATICDNNHPQQLEFVERSTFARLWAGYGGFALTCLDDPANCIPWRSYQRL